MHREGDMKTQGEEGQLQAKEKSSLLTPSSRTCSLQKYEEIKVCLGCPVRDTSLQRPQPTNAPSPFSFSPEHFSIPRLYVTFLCCSLPSSPRECPSHDVGDICLSHSQLPNTGRAHGGLTPHSLTE